MALPTAAEITNWYLYGQKTTPTPTELVSDKWIRPPIILNKNGDSVFADESLLTSIDINTSEFMSDDGPGRFAVGGQFPLVKHFFDPSKGSLPVGSYTKQQVADKLFFSKTAIDENGKPAHKFSWQMKQYNYDDANLPNGKNDYAERSYIYNTGSFSIADDARFVVKKVIDKDGKKSLERSIKNFAIIPHPTVQENFDFKSNSTIAKLGNPFLEASIDPSKIGRRVDINFTNPNNVTRRDYSLDNYKDDIESIKKIYNSSALSLPMAMNRISSVLENDGVTNFLDKDGRLIVYGTDGSDKFDSKVFSENPTFMARRSDTSNGIVFIAGKGIDTLTNAPANSTVIGGAGADNYEVRFAKAKLTIADPAPEDRLSLSNVAISGVASKVAAVVPANDNQLKVCSDYRMVS